MGHNECVNALKLHAIKNVGSLYESHKNFLDYCLSSDFGCEVLSKNKMKTHLDSGNIYYNNLNMREYLFMIAQQDETKKLVDFNLDINDDFDFYLNEVIIVQLTINLILILIVHQNFYFIILIT